MSYSSGFILESWFTGFAKRARILDTTPLDLPAVMAALNTHVPKRVERASPFIEDSNDPMEWLDKTLKIDCILSLEDINRRTWRIGVDVTYYEPRIDIKLSHIASPQFRLTRRQLGLDRHYLILFENENLPDEAELLESLYEQVDLEQETALIDWKS